MGMSGQQPPPFGPPPFPPPSGPPPGKGWPQAQSAPPPYGGGPPYFGPPPGPPPAPRRRWPIILAGALAVLLVAGLSVTAWAFFTGRFGVGPLSAKDKAAVSAIAEGVEAPEWTDAEARECAADELVHESRSAELEKRGLIDADGDGWTYTGEWRYSDATTYTEALLDCSDDWVEQLGDEWELESSDCLAEIGASTMAGFVVAETLTLSEGQDAADEGRAEAVSALDECYLADPPEPSAKARPAYRAVVFTFDDLGPEVGTATLQVRDDGAWKPLGGNNTHAVDTDAGGRKGCVEAQAEATFPWGSTTTTDKRFCGRSQPARIWWVRAKNCTYTSGCTTWDLRYEGFASFDTQSVRLLENGGDCNSESGQCEHTFITGATGRGVAVSWSVYPGYDERFEARIRKMTARLPN